MRPEVLSALREWMEEPAADPGRVHEEGRRVRARIEEARDQVASLLRVRPRQVVFTSGGTESVNAAVWGATRARPGAVVLSARVEHSSVREASERLADVEDLPVDDRARIDPGGVAAALARHRGDPPALVHCQWANHEVGTVQPVAEVVAECRRAGVPVHVDAAAACGHLDVDLGGLDADLVSVSGHKLGSPPGVGALVVRRGLRVEPYLVGGQQERGRRAGMEPVGAIVGMGAAAGVLAAGGRVAVEAAQARSQVERIASAALAVEGVELVGDPDPAGRLPHLVCTGVAGVEAEPVLLGLDRAGVAAHSGSSCASESLEPSPVLEAMGVDPSRSLRLSVGWSTTEDDVDAFAEAFGPVVEGLRRLRG